MALTQLEQTSDKSTESENSVKLLESLKLISNSQFEAAYDSLKTLASASPSDSTIMSNFAVASLYCNRVPEACGILEDIIRSNPTEYVYFIFLVLYVLVLQAPILFNYNFPTPFLTLSLLLFLSLPPLPSFSHPPHRALTESLVSNLCAMYDLCSARSSVKKRVIARIVDDYAHDAFDKSVVS